MSLTWTEVAEREAQGTTASLYADVRRTLGVEHVPTLYRVLAAREDALATLWPPLRPLLASPAADGLAVEAREAGRSLARELGAGPVELEPGVAAAVRAALEAFNTANPRNFLFATAARRALGDVGETDGVAWELAPGSDAAAEAPAELAGLMDEIRLAHGSVAVPGIYRTLARWPEALPRLWGALRPLVGSDRMAAAGASLHAAADRAMAAWDEPLPAVPPDRELAATLDWFVSAAPAVILEIEFLKDAISRNEVPA